MSHLYVIAIRVNNSLIDDKVSVLGKLLSPRSWVPVCHQNTKVFFGSSRLQVLMKIRLTVRFNYFLTV